MAASRIHTISGDGRTNSVALTIAGSDSGGGAGIQADLKAFAACGVHGACAITAITAQNTLGVQAVHAIPPEILRAQVAGRGGGHPRRRGEGGDARQPRDDRGPWPPRWTSSGGVPVVVDPVMVAESGARLLEEDAHEALVEQILPRASVLTPNVPEARALLGEQPAAGADEEEAERLARAVLALGPAAVVLTGGHRDSASDLLVTPAPHDGAQAGEALAIEGPRHPDGAAHGSGCTHSAALAAQLALGQSLCRRLGSARLTRRGRRRKTGCASSAAAPGRST